MKNALPYDVAQVNELSTALLNSYDFVRRLTHSGTIVIYEVISTRGRLRGRHLALKKEKTPHSANLIPAVSLHRAICHPNIVALHSVIDFSSAPHFAYWHVLEFCSEGNLSDLLHSRNSPDFLEPELRLITKGITSALVFLKEEQIIHRNIDSTNILLGQGRKPKICDFKHAVRVHVEKSSILQPLTGTVHPAPELLTIPSQYDFAVDTWSFGCVLYICIGGTIDDIPSLVSGNLSPKCSPELRSLILSLLNTSADKRLDIEQVPKSAYLMFDPCTSQPDSFGNSLRSLPRTHMSSTSKQSLKSLSSVSPILPVLESQEDSQNTQKQNPRRACTSSTNVQSKKRPALKDIGNIPLPRFLQDQLESGKGLSLNLVKGDYCSSSATVNVPKPPSDNSQTSLTFLGKLSKAENFVPVEPSADDTSRAVLPIGTTRPLPINANSLPPKMHKLANGTITILASHALLVDFRQNQRRHGLQGDQIMLIEGKSVSIFDAPHLSVPSCLMEPVHIYGLSELPPMYWKQYNDAANFVDQIRRKIPHVTVYESEAKCTLMSNPPPSDIEIILYGEDSASDKRKSRGFKAKLQTPTMRIQYSRQRHHLELAQKITGDRGIEWKKERRTCLDSSEISRILLLGDTNQLGRKGLTVLLDFLKTCDQLESPAPVDTERTNLLSLTPSSSVPALNFQPATLLSTSLPLVSEKVPLLEDSRYLESVGWCIRRPDNVVSGGTKYQILFLDGVSLMVDLTEKIFFFSSSHGGPIRCHISDHGRYPAQVQKYAYFIHNFISLF